MRGDSLERVVAEARAIADEAGQPLTTAHLLLALFTVPNPAERVLASQRLDDDALLARVKDLPREAPEEFRRTVERAREVARGTGGADAGTLHLLVALARSRGTAAVDLLLRAGASPADLARLALSCLTGPMPRRFLPREEPRDERPPPREREPATVAATSLPPAQARGAAAPAPAPAPRPTIPPPTAVPVPVGDPQRASRLSALRRLAEGLDPAAAPSPWALSPEEYPWLSSMGRNLSELAAAGRIDPVIGRAREIEEVLDILGKRRSNNPLLVGEPGVGKTAVVEGVALRLVEKSDPKAGRVVVQLDMASILAGTQLRGSLSEKLSGVKDEVRRAAGRVVVFIDEIHTIVGAGATAEGPQDAAQELKAALARGEFPCIGATTHAEFQKYFAQDAALERRFMPVRVDEPTVAQTTEILRGLVPFYARHHGVEFDPDALEAAASLSARLIRDRCLPDKAVAVLDHAGSRAKREGTKTVGRADVARVVARLAGIPEERVLPGDADRLLSLEKELSRRVVGHAAVVERVARTVRRSFAGFSGRRPLGSFIFVGPPGVGKTHLARTLADAVFGGTEPMVRVDMSEFSEGHAVARLVGAPPGYVGYGEGGQLTEAVRRNPACVVLFDEIEKAHRDTQQLILQVLDEGHLADGRGRRVDFSSTLVVLASNLGAEAFQERFGRAVGFGAGVAPGADRAARALELAREGFPPELWGRIEERLVFAPLSRSDVRRIALLLAAESSARLVEDKQIRFELDESAVEYLLDHGGWDETTGARGMRQTLARLVEGPLAERILRREIGPGDRIRVMVRREELVLEQLTTIVPSMAAP